MAYSESLADRIRLELGAKDGIEEKRMFGGLCFLDRGHMVCGIVGDSLCLRLAREGAKVALERVHVRPMDFTGKPLATMVYVDPPGIRTPERLREWIQRASAFAATLPAKAAKRSKRTTPRKKA